MKLLSLGLFAIGIGAFAVGFYAGDLLTCAEGTILMLLAYINITHE